MPRGVRRSFADDLREMRGDAVLASGRLCEKPPGAGGEPARRAALLFTHRRLMLKTPFAGARPLTIARRARFFCIGDVFGSGALEDILGRLAVFQAVGVDRD